jgi:broad specificity phosphatase PhoE
VTPSRRYADSVPVILLIRHGQASFGRENYDELSELGRRQSEIVGRELARRSLRNPLAVCGTLRRQVDTARIALAEARLAVEPSVDARWDEYNHGSLLKHFAQNAEAPSPTSSRELQVLLDDALLRWVQEDDDAGWGAFSGGALSALDDLIDATGRSRDAVVFTSGGVIAAICAGLLAGSAKSMVMLNRMAINAGITKLVTGPSGVFLSTYNEYGHLGQSNVTSR